MAIAQIEHIDAVRSIDEILAVPGLDSIVFGPNDLSGSMGCIGEPGTPEVVRAMEEVMSRARGTKVAYDCGGASIDDMEYWIKQGVHWILTATDVALMLKEANEIVERLRRIGPAPG